MRETKQRHIFLPIIAMLALLSAGAARGQSHSVPIDPFTNTNVIRVACIGDSITAGYKLENPTRDCYPAQLATMVGPHWKIVNFGIPGLTCMAETDKPIAQAPTIPEALFLDPDLVIIILGTNDAKTENWKNSARFVSDYVDLIRTFTQRGNKPSVWICTPPPIFTDGGNRPSGEIIQKEVLPKLLEIAEKTQVTVIDLYTPFADRADLFPDAVHPNATGARLIAEHIYRAITGHVPPAQPKP